MHPVLIDTFPAFLSFWERTRACSMEDQISAWAQDYLAPWPELFTILAEDYRTQGIEWRDIARQRIFPFLEARLEAMATAHANLTPLCELISRQTKQALGFETSITFVIYVGIGCGAGWAATWQGSPAVLLGLENIAEEGWTDSETLASLLAHEVSHLAYFHWREQAGLPCDNDPWGQLIDEGFATYCESKLIRPGKFHEDAGTENDWSEWCRANEGWLAGEFLRCVEADQPVAKFFGSWLEIEGHSQAGYFLGHQVISELADQGLSLKEIALLDPQAIGMTALKALTAEP